MVKLTKGNGGSIIKLKLNRKEVVDDINNKAMTKQKN
jgi:hypothetical protein